MSEKTGVLIRQNPTNTPKVRHLTHTPDGIPPAGTTVVTFCGLVKQVPPSMSPARGPKRDHCPLCVWAADVQHPGWRL